MIIDFDKVLERVGEFKRYQIYHYVLIGIASMPVGMHTLANVFLAATPNHWCSDPQNANFSRQDLRGVMPKDGTSSPIERECTVFARKGGELTRNLTSLTVTNNSVLTACTDWTFDKSVYDSTITTEWNLVCSDAWKALMAQSLFMTGFLLGAVIVGALSDRIGRKLSWYIALMAVVFSGITAAFMPEYWSHVIMRLVSGAACAGYYTVGFVLSMETVGKSYRVKTAIMYQGFFASGYMILAAMAYFIRNFAWLQLAISITPAIFLSYYCFIGESPRWLITQGRLTQARHELRRMSRMNKSEYVDDLLEKEANYLVTTKDSKMKNVEKTMQDRKYSVIDLVRTPNLRKTSCNLFFNWFVNSFVYYGLSQGISELSGSVYWNLFIAGAMEITALILCVCALERVGRRWPIAILMMVGGLACLACVPIPEGMDITRTILSMIGRFCIAGSFSIIYIFSAELFPTVLRTTGIGTGSMYARLGGLIAPFVTELGRLFWKPLPMVLFGSASVVAGLLALTLPETFNRHLPDTIEDAENFGKRRPSAGKHGKATNGTTDHPLPLLSNGTSNDVSVP